MKTIQMFFISMLFIAAQLQGQAQAVLTIEITKGVEGALPVAIAPFQGDEGFFHADDINAIVTSDLARSGRFDLLPEEDMLEKPGDAADVNYRNWRMVNVEYLLLGNVYIQPDNWLRVEIQLMDVLRQKVVFHKRFRVIQEDIRAIAHHISDVVYEKLTGERGAFSTRIAYVTSQQMTKGIVYRLIVADADGFNPRTVLESREPLMSPAWSPDGKYLAYVSFEKRRSEIYVQEILTGRRTMISSSKGINGAPAWSPDGTQLALTLSKGGNPDIYVVSARGGMPRQLTRSWAIDTEPAWAPDGRNIVFTSDRGGKPQIYRVPVNGASEPQRITFEGDYNTRASYAPDGESLVMVHRNNGNYRIAVMNLDSGLVQVLSEGKLDESPSFAPNGSMILYATEVNNRGVLAGVSADGRVHQRLVSQEGHVREPAWSPYFD